MRPLYRMTLCLGLTLGFTLACAGTPTDGVDQPQPEPEPAPEPKPEPAPNADKCANFRDQSLPISGGTITACSENAVTIDHTDGDPKALRWDYAEKYQKAGWMRGDPVKANPTVNRGADTLVFTADDKSVTITSSGGGGGGPGGPGGRPGRPGRPGRGK